MNLTRKRVAVLRGGKNHFSDSINSGAFILNNIPENFSKIDILVDKDNRWHYNGLPKKPENILNQIDFVWNSLYGSEGESGFMQNFLKTHGIKHSSSPVVSSFFSQNKQIAKDLFLKNGIKTPTYKTIKKDNLTKSYLYEIFSHIPHPVIVKPLLGSLSHKIYISHTFGELQNAIEKIFQHYDSALVEEYIKGHEVSIGLIDNFRGESNYVLTPVLLKSKENEDFSVFHHNKNYDYFLNTFNYEEINQIKNTIIKAHNLLKTKNFINANIILHPKRGLFLIEVDTNPHLTENSPFIYSLEALGIKPNHFIEHIISIN